MDQQPEDKVRDRILAAASRLFARYGFKKTTVEDIARELGSAKSSLYHYFDCKEAIFAEVVRRESRTLLLEIARAVARAPNPRDKIRAFIQTRMARIKELSNLHQVSDGVISELLPLAEDARQDYFKQEIRLLEDILDQGREAGVFDVDRPDLVATMILSAFKGIEWMAFSVRGAPELEEGVQVMLEILFRGLAPIPEQAR